MSRPPRSLLRLLLVLVVLAAWEGAVRLFKIPAYVLPAPSKVCVALYHGIASMLYVRQLWITLVETLLGFVGGSIVALVLGTLVALSRRCEYFLYPFVLMFQAMPKVALAPLIIIWFGLGLGSKIAQAGLTAFFPLMVNTIVGLRSADEDRIALMRSLDASEMQIFRMLRVPGAMPFIFAGFEIAMMLSLIGAIVAEFVGAQRGLGVLIMSMTYTMDVAGQFSVLIVLSLLGYSCTPSSSSYASGCYFGTCRRAEVPMCPSREKSDEAPLPVCCNHMFSEYRRI